MAQLEDPATGTRVTGLTASSSAAVESAQWICEQGFKVVFRDSDGHPGERFVYRDDEPSLELVEMGRPWSFGCGGVLLRLVSEAYLFNPAWFSSTVTAVTTLSCHKEKTDNMTRLQCH